MSAALHQKWNTFKKILESHRRLLIAFSGGCDSAFLLATARQTLGRENVLAVTAVSASLPMQERQTTEVLARQLNVSHLFLSTDELNNPAYASNPSNRCFFCKDELFGRLSPIAQQ